MIINEPQTLEQVKAAFSAYEAALIGNDVAELNGFFFESDLALRYGIAENLYGFEAVRAFRAARSPAGLARTLEKTQITTYGNDFAVVSTLFRRASFPDKIGRQMQSWARFDVGWRIVAAHVSVIDDPEGKVLP